MVLEVGGDTNHNDTIILNHIPGQVQNLKLQLHSAPVAHLHFLLDPTGARLW